MSQIYFLHGNPGHTSDWDILIEKLPKDLSINKVDSYSDKWIDDIKNTSGKVLVVAHSWGCYRLLSHIKQIEHKIERIFLINPYLIQEKPLSSVAQFLMSMPKIGNSLLEANHKKSYATFVEEMIYPQSIKDNLYYNKKMELLSDLESWKKAVVGKQMQQKSPIAHDSKVLGFAYIGGQDKTLNHNTQNAALKKFTYIKQNEIKDGGHGILWSHPEIIARDILFCAKKVGYYPSSTVKNNVFTFMEKHMEEYGEKIALKWANPEALNSWDGNHAISISHDQITFRELEDRIARFAQGLLEIGIKKGERVIIFLPMSVDMYISMFAVQRIGGIAVFLDSWARSHHLGASAECVQPKAMISFDMAFKLIEQVPEFSSMPIRVLYGPGEKFTHKYADLFSKQRSSIAAVESEFSALITFTTGSTGKPKGANRTHRFLSAQHFALTHVIPYVETDFDMPAFPIFSLNSLATGVTTVLPAINLAQPQAFDSALLACQILNQKITCTTLSPSMLVGLAKYCKEKQIQLTGLRRVVTGGAPISKDDVREFYQIATQTELWILYGSTEAEPMAHIEGREMLHAEIRGDAEIVENGVNVGEISEDIDYKFIRIENGPIEFKGRSWNELEVGLHQVGEFICTGDHVCREYYNNTEAFKNTKILDDNNRVWHRTGDLAYIDDKKNLWIVGRTNNAIERKGSYYFPVRSEVLLKRLDFTGRCAFLGIASTDQKFDQETCAVVELKSDIKIADFDFSKAKTEILRIFNKNDIPLDHIKFVKSIPMDPRHHSKVEYAILRKMLLENPEVIIA